MDRRRQKQKRLGQNFLRSRRLAERLVALSSIGPADVVYEIGPGRGMLTVELARRAARVIAVERDPGLVRRLRGRFADTTNVEVVECDFLKYRILAATGGFKVFSNVPFGTTARLMRKLLHERPIAAEMYLILQREAAMKYSGSAGETVQSLLAKPFFSFEPLFRLRRTDFDPVPDVDSIFLKVMKLSVSAQTGFAPNRTSYVAWESFVRLGFCSWRPSLRLVLRREFSYRRWKRLSRRLGFAINARPSEVTFEQWAALFHELTSGGS